MTNSKFTYTEFFEKAYRKQLDAELEAAKYSLRRFDLCQEFMPVKSQFELMGSEFMVLSYKNSYAKGEPFQVCCAYKNADGEIRQTTFFSNQFPVTEWIEKSQRQTDRQGKVSI